MFVWTHRDVCSWYEVESDYKQVTKRVFRESSTLRQQIVFFVFAVTSWLWNFERVFWKPWITKIATLLVGSFVGKNFQGERPWSKLIFADIDFR